MNAIVKTKLFLIIMITIIVSCNNQKPKSGEIYYDLIRNNHLQIENSLKKFDEAKRDSLYKYYTSQYSKYDTTKFKLYFDLSKRMTKEVVISSTNKSLNDYYKSAEITKYRANNTELVWMETYNGKRYKIKETLSPGKTMIPYFNADINNVQKTDNLLGLSVKSGEINFMGVYPGLSFGKFHVWYADKIPLSVGPEEFFVKDLFLLKAIAEQESLIIEATKINFIKLDENIFDIPSVFDKEVTMEEFHHEMGM